MSLPPCPFCGDVDRNFALYNSGGADLGCMDCGASAVIEAWNKRRHDEPNEGQKPAQQQGGAPLSEPTPKGGGAAVAGLLEDALAHARKVREELPSLLMPSAMDVHFVALLEEIEHYQYAEIEHDTLGCPVAKTGIYATGNRHE